MIHDPADQASRRLLTQFASKNRSWLANVFLDPIRSKSDPATTPEAVVGRVRQYVTRQLPRHRPQTERGQILILLRRLLDDPMSLDYAAHALYWDTLTKAQKAQVRAGRTPYEDGPLGKPEPTQKQINYLRFLGYRGEAPSTIGEASSLIAELKASAPMAEPEATEDVAPPVRRRSLYRDLDGLDDEEDY